MNNKPSRIFEYIWAIISIIVLVTAVYGTIKNGISNSWVLFILFIIALMMYYARKMQSKNNNGIQ